MTTEALYAVAFAARVTWGVLSVRRWWKPAAGWAPLRTRIVALEIFTSSSALLCAAALWAGEFAAWMLWPVGAAALLTLPVPCTIEAVNRIGWVHVARNVVFLLFAMTCFALAGGWIPLARIGL